MIFDKKRQFRTFTVGHWDNGQWIDDAKNTNNFDKADIIIFPGGVDVSPTYYNEPRGRYTQVDKPSDRDLNEISIYNKAVEQGKYIVGICRGLICSSL